MKKLSENVLGHMNFEKSMKEYRNHVSVKVYLLSGYCSYAIDSL